MRKLKNKRDLDKNDKRSCKKVMRDDLKIKDILRNIFCNLKLKD